MTREELFESLSHTDPQLLQRSEGTAKPVWPRRVCAAAACLLLAAAVTAGGAALLPRLTRSHDGHAPGSLQLQQPVDPVEPAQPEEPVENAPPAALTLCFNDLTQSPAADGALRQNVFLFSEPLTGPQLAQVTPDPLPAGAAVEGAAIYTGYNALWQVSLEVNRPGWPAAVTVALHSADRGMDFSCYVLPEDNVVSSTCGGVSITAYRFADGSRTLLWAEFTRDGVCYTVSTDAPAAQEDAAQAALTEAAACWAAMPRTPDLDSFVPTAPPFFQDTQLTAQQALADPDFGSLFLPAPPEGFAAESIRRYQDQTQNTLSGLWTHGYDELRWTVRPFTDADAVRLVTAAEPEKYDLSRYPIPRAESVPQALREVVDDPIFAAEELTEALVWTRAYTVVDVGDSGGWRMRFSVRYGDLLVTVSSKGVNPDWVFAQLQALAQ